METKRPVEEIADLRIVDNWLDPNDFKTIKDLFYHEDTTWNLVPGISNNDSTNAIKYGIQFIAMNFQEKDNNLDKYNYFFDNKGVMILAWSFSVGLW